MYLSHLFLLIKLEKIGLHNPEVKIFLYVFVYNELIFPKKGIFGSVSATCSHKPYSVSYGFPHVFT